MAGLLKVFAYITQGEALLVFRHVDFPEAGLQVPAGTVKASERLEDAVLREAREETGLEGLRVVGYLGKATYDMTPWGGEPAQRRHFFHLEADSAPACWRHAETDGGAAAPILFDLSWVEPQGGPALIAGHDQMLPRLCSRDYRALPVP